MTQLGKDLSIRLANGNDLNFIFSSFCDSMKSGSVFGKQMGSTGIFKKCLMPVIDEILRVSTTLIACQTENPNVILGYLIFQPGKIHYALTKGSWQRMGIFKALYEASELWEGKDPRIKCTFQTKDSLPIFGKYKQFHYEPRFEWVLKHMGDEP